MGENQKGPIDEINELLEKIKEKLNGPEERGKKYHLYIEDQANSPSRGRTEDIELKISQLRLLK